jgi:hypothetical protein
VKDPKILSHAAFIAGHLSPVDKAEVARDAAARHRE